MTQPLSTPPIKPFARLQVTDGLLMTADRWRRAHDYHRQRQNLYYQALHQPGIVCGLGVHLIAAPADVPSKYQDGRWVQIQPGIAIDLAGNPIVVSEPIDFRITTKPVVATPLMVYLVLSYVDPDTLNRPDQPEMVQETFRVDEKNNHPNELDVELCRILLEPDSTQLEYPADVFSPKSNQLDFRDRVQAQMRPQAVVQVAQVMQNDLHAQQRLTQLTALMGAIAPLYPALQTASVKQVTLPTNAQSEAFHYDLLYLTGTGSFLPTEPERQALRSYLGQGGVLLVDVPPGGASLAKSVMDFAKQIDTPLEYLNHLSHSHPLRTQPFLFAAFPKLGDQPIQVLVGGGIVLILGDLGSGWGLDEALLLPREVIRSAQEFGINILNFAWKRRSWMQLMQQEPGKTPDQEAFSNATPLPDGISTAPAAQTAEKIEKSTPKKVKSIFDQLDY